MILACQQSSLAEAEAEAAAAAASASATAKFQGVFTELGVNCKSSGSCHESTAAALHVKHSRQYNVQGLAAMAGQVLHAVKYLNVGIRGTRTCHIQAIALAPTCDRMLQT